MKWPNQSDPHTRGETARLPSPPRFLEVLSLALDLTVCEGLWGTSEEGHIQRVQVLGTEVLGLNPCFTLC